MLSPNTFYVLLGSILLTASTALVGTFTLLRKRALVGDAVAHAVLPGVCLAFLAQGEKNPWVLLLGASVTGWLALRAVDWLPAHTRIKPDSAIGIVLSVFFGIGILLLTAIQQSGNAAQSGLDKFLFGNAAAITPDILYSFGVVAALLLVAVLLLRKEWALLSFDAEFGAVMGLPVRALELTLSTLTVLAVVVCIQAVGVVLVAAMLVTPAIAARQLTHRLGTMLALAVAIGVVSGLVGVLVSYQMPGMPTGPWMVLVVSAIAIVAVLFSPDRGVLARMARQRVAQRRILAENILKTLYHLDEVGTPASSHATASLTHRHTALGGVTLDRALRRLQRQGLVDPVGLDWRLTTTGTEAARAVVRRHRLWEAYLTHQLRLPADHVHDDAETMEHILTPELEAELERILCRPETDPHDEKIPY